MPLKVSKEALAGTLESSDVLVKVGPSEKSEPEIIIHSQVMKQFGKQIKRVVTETLNELSVNQISVSIEDKGALDCVIKARVQAAVLRGAASEKLNWSQLL